MNIVELKAMKIEELAKLAKNSLPCGVCGVGIPGRRNAAQKANGGTPHAPAILTLRAFGSLVKGCYKLSSIN